MRASHQRTHVIRGLHHSAYRCRDSEQTRAFYEDFLGLPLAGTLEISETKSGRATETLHTFYELGDGSYLAFFEAPDMPFEFKAQHDFDLHIALEVDAGTLGDMLARGKAAGHRDAGRLGPRIHSFHLFPRSERLRDRADREDSRARSCDGPFGQWRTGEARSLDQGPPQNFIVTPT